MKVTAQPIEETGKRGSEREREVDLQRTHHFPRAN